MYYSSASCRSILSCRIFEPLVLDAECYHALLKWVIEEINGELSK